MWKKGERTFCVVGTVRTPYGDKKLVGHFVPIFYWPWRYADFGPNFLWIKYTEKAKKDSVALMRASSSMSLPPGPFLAHWRTSKSHSKRDRERRAQTGTKEGSETSWLGGERGPERNRGTQRGCCHSMQPHLVVSIFHTKRQQCTTPGFAVNWFECKIQILNRPRPLNKKKSIFS